MAPHDLLCRWCSTFVGKDKKFCSIFCESRFTRSKRRKLGFKRPVHSSGADGQHADYESPRTNNTAPNKKGAFLEDVITAMRIENTGQRTDGANKDTSGEHQSVKPKTADIPKLDLNQLKDRNSKIEHSKVKLQTNITPRSERSDTKIPIRTKTITISKSDTTSHAHSTPEVKDKPDTSNPEVKDKQEKVKSNFEVKQKSEKAKPDTTYLNKYKSEIKDKQEKYKSKTEHVIDTAALNGFTDANVLPSQKPKTATELEKRVRSSGYGAPVNPRLRPLALKPRSANMLPSKPRQSSASSTKSAQAAMALPAISRDNSRQIISGKTQSKWELIPTTIKEETDRSKGDATMKKSLENENPTPKNPLNATKGRERSTTRSDETSRIDTTRSDLTQIRELLREESTASDLLDNSVLQERLSSIKRKVEVKRRGRDSRSSVGSELDSSFMDSTYDLTTDRENLNNSHGKNKPTPSSRISTRSNITRISQNFNKKEKI